MISEFQVKRKEVPIYFKNKKDLQNRIVHLWMDQRDDEYYVFSFGDEQTEEAFNVLVKDFNIGDGK